MLVFVWLGLLAVSGAYTHHDHDHDYNDYHDHDHHNHGHHGHDHHDHGHHECGVQKEKQPVTVTPAGEIRGSYMTTRRGRQFESYRGIKYAEPPVGELRFQPPKPILQYASPVNASEDGPACPLPAPPTYFVDEDCLTINVYTPLKSERSRPLPVMFFIHPGGFYSMTGRSDLAGPHYLLDQDLVLVAINYRLGSLGFLSTGDKWAPGNNGFRDQVVALRWVQRNIAAFGGDPHNVTISGCSAGAISVALHMISPMSKGLFHRGISMSGSPIGKVATPRDQYDLAVRQAEILNCPTNSSKVIIDCLKTKHWRDLGNSLLQFQVFGYDPVGLWTAVVEDDFGQERFLPIDPLVAIRERKFQAVPYIISQTQDEFYWFAYTALRNQTLLNRINSEWERIAPISFLLPEENRAVAVKRIREHYLQNRPLKNDEESADRLGRAYADSVIGMTVNRLVKVMSKYSSQPVWYYEFAYTGNHSHYEDPTTGRAFRPFHHDDLIYLFTLRYRYPDIGLDGSDAQIVDFMTTMWSNFATYGDPNRGNPLNTRWGTYKPDDRKYLRIANDLSIRKNLYEDRYQFWEELYPIQY